MNGLKYALKCLAACTEKTLPDAKGHVFVYRTCGGCDQAGFCNKIMSTMGSELDMRTALARQQA